LPQAPIKALEVLKDINCNIGILTKSKLVLRDIDFLKQMKNIEVGISMNTIDDTFRKLIEPYASSVEDRINTLKELKKNGIRTYVFMSPIFPFITDFKSIIEKTKNYVSYYGFENLNLRANYKYDVLNFINNHYKALYNDYKKIYIDGDKSYWNSLEMEIKEYCKQNNINYRMYFHHDSIKK
jgi:DNA repair photolyase